MGVVNGSNIRVRDPNHACLGKTSPDVVAPKARRLPHAKAGQRPSHRVPVGISLATSRLIENNRMFTWSSTLSCGSFSHAFGQIQTDTIFTLYYYFILLLFHSFLTRVVQLDVLFSLLQFCRVYLSFFMAILAFTRGFACVVLGINYCTKNFPVGMKCLTGRKSSSSHFSDFQLSLCKICIFL